MTYEWAHRPISTGNNKRNDPPRNWDRIARKGVKRVESAAKEAKVANVGWGEREQAGPKKGM